MTGDRNRRTAAPFVLLTLLPLLFLALPAATADAATMESPRCRAARYRATAAHLEEYVRCRLEESDDVQACQNTAFTELADLLASLDARRGCILSPDHLALSGEVYATVSIQLPHLLGFPDIGSRCAVARWSAATRYGRLALRAQARNARHANAAALQRRLATLATQLSVALSRAASEGDCVGGAGPDAPSVADEVARLVEGVCPICGNGRRGPGEECDGGDALECPGLCTSECVCGPPVCGDGQVTGDEECDGAVDDVCPGLCQSDCRCPESFCGNDVAEVGEECDGTDAAACDTPFAFSQCGAPGELDACECSSILVQPDACPAPMSCPAGQSCVTLGLLLPSPTVVHGCVPPEPLTCSGADQCTRAGATCEDGSCCGTIGTVCTGDETCCADDGLQCGSSHGGIGTCCREPLMPCLRDADCCNFTCTTDGSGERFCAFF